MKCSGVQRTDSPPGSNMLRLAYADSGSACKLAGVQIIPLPTVANQILARTFFRLVAHPLACLVAGKFSRASSAGPPTALAMKFRKPDRVGRRGLSEPREDFSRLITYAWTQKWFVQFFGSGLICPRTQTCMDSKVVRADFGQWTDLPRAQTCCAELRRLARLANSPGFKSFRCPR